MHGFKHNALPNLEPFTGFSQTKQFAFSLLSNEQMNGSEHNEHPRQRRVSRRSNYQAQLDDLKQPKLSGLERHRAETGKLIAAAVAKYGSGPVDIADWIEANVYDWSKVIRYKGVFDYSSAPRLILEKYQKEILRKIWTQDENGEYPYSTVIWSQPKKNGKTQIAGAVGAWFSENVEPPNVIFTLASSQEQSAGLIFTAMVPSIYALGGQVPNTTQSVPLIMMPNGTIIRAIPNSYEGQAGGNYGLTLWSETWAYKSERDRRLWDEMPPVPTRKTSVRWVETYAGFENESNILIDQYKRVFGYKDSAGELQPDFTEKRMQEKAIPVPGLEHIQTDGRPSCWHIPDEGFFMFWDHEIRGPWITEKYMRGQKASNRHSTNVRLWENRWQSSEGTYIDPQMWDNAVTLDNEEWSPMFLAGDASQRNDSTALVGVEKQVVRIFGDLQDRYRLKLVRVWDPQGQDIDLDETIANYVHRVYKAGCMLGPFRYDSYQMHQVAVNLRKKGVPCVEFPQGQERLKADSFLWKLFNEGRIDVYPSAVLESHVKAANAKEYENEQVRIIKGTASESNKVDGAVALSMACWSASMKIDRKRKKKKSKSVSMWEG
jgi:hypothetical protein